MIGFAARWVAKLSGPALVYVLLGLVAANALTGYLLKEAWQDNARANLECENQALRDANEANAKVSAELLRLKQQHEEYRKQVREATALADMRNADVLRAMEIRHEAELAALEVATDEITDDEFFCASEPAARSQLDRMRDAAKSYNENRTDH